MENKGANMSLISFNSLPIVFFKNVQAVQCRRFEIISRGT